MPPSKRSRRGFAPDADSLLAIRVAEEEDGVPPLAADRLLLQVASECASGLPSDATTWDLSGLLVDGQPVRREVVLAWLHAVTQNKFKQPFSEPQQEPLLATSAAGLAQLLSFAGAVGYIDSVLEACLPQELEELRFRVAAGGGREVELEAGGAYAWDGDEPLQLQRQPPDQTTATELATLPSAEAKAALVQQFASQLEALLYLAHRLELDSLVALLHSCMRCNTAWPNSLPSHDDSVIDPRVMSARVLEAAGVGPQAGQQAQAAFINSIATQPCSFVDDEGHRQVFRPLNLTAQQKQPIKFEAELTRDFVGAGSRGQRVAVELDLFGESVMKVVESSHVVQLLVGHRVDDDALQALKDAHAQQHAAAQ